MIRKRYTDTKKMIVDVSKFELINTTEVLVYHEDKWYNEVIVNLEGQEEKFEELKPHIAYIVKNLCKLDMIAQKYSVLHGDSKFADCYEVAYIRFIDFDEVCLTYYGIHENTEFDVVFQCADDAFFLKRFGMVKNIVSGWDVEKNK
uniref:hypothetical protein n=1 Tax=Agathobacter sp. TaxID=2021311 RepID=UPI0040568C1F